MGRKVAVERLDMKIMYDVKSERAEEFISDAEIRETMAYAEAHKDDRPYWRKHAFAKGLPIARRPCCWLPGSRT